MHKSIKQMANDIKRTFQNCIGMSGTVYNEAPRRECIQAFIDELLEAAGDLEQEAQETQDALDAGEYDDQ